MTKVATTLDVIRGVLQPKKPSSVEREDSSERIELSHDVVVLDAEGSETTPPTYAFRSVFNFQRYRKMDEKIN